MVLVPTSTMAKALGDGDRSDQAVQCRSVAAGVDLARVSPRGEKNGPTTHSAYIVEMQKRHVVPRVLASIPLD